MVTRTQRAESGISRGTSAMRRRRTAGAQQLLWFITAYLNGTIKDVYMEVPQLLKELLPEMLQEKRLDVSSEI